MTKLFKSAFDVEKITFNIHGFNGYVSRKEAQRIVSLPQNLSEDDIVEQRDEIEKCASSNSPYYYSNKWDVESVQQLKEYACVCKCQMCEADPEDNKIQEMAKQDTEKTEKTASTATKIDVGLRDPFQKDIDSSYMDKKDWQKLTPEQKLSKPNTLMSSSSIIGVGGGEDYSVNPHLNTKRGQNSVTTPDSIGSLINADQKDTGIRLREEKKAREENRKTEITAWEKKMVMEADEKGYGSLPHNKVMITESLNSQPGIRGKEAFNFDLPEKTEGEQIKEQNNQRKASIQREQTNDDKEWDKPQQQSMHLISDTFMDSLKKNLEKIPKK